MAFHRLEECFPSKQFGVHDLGEGVRQWEFQKPCCTPRVVVPKQNSATLVVGRAAMSNL